MSSPLTLTSSTGYGLAVGFLADHLLGDPRRGHPVAAFGALAQRVERLLYRDSRWAGAAYAGVLVGGAGLLGVGLQRLTGSRPAARTVAVATATWVVLGGRSLAREAAAVARLLDADDLPAAREQITHLVGRDPRWLSNSELARATIESVAENSSDAVVAPLVWGALLGLPGLLAYRAVNTLDAMVGHRSARYHRFGWAAARVDDVVNWLPARLTAVLAAANAGLVGGSARKVWETVQRDADRHPSPNAGVVEAAFAGALGVRLGGTNHYAGVTEDRGILGDGRPVRAEDIPRAARLFTGAGLGAAVLAVVVGWRG